MTRRTMFTCPNCGYHFEITSTATICPYCKSSHEFTDCGDAGYKYLTTTKTYTVQDGGGGGSELSVSLPFAVMAVVIMSVIVFFLSNWLIGLINPTAGLIIAIILTIITAIAFTLLLYPGLLFGTIITVIVYFVTALIGIMPTISMIICLATFILSSMIINYKIKG